MNIAKIIILNPSTVQHPENFHLMPSKFKFSENVKSVLERRLWEAKEEMDKKLDYLRINARRWCENPKKIIRDLQA